MRRVNKNNIYKLNTYRLVQKLKDHLKFSHVDQFCNFTFTFDLKTWRTVKMFTNVINNLNLCVNKPTMRYRNDATEDLLFLGQLYKWQGTGSFQTSFCYFPLQNYLMTQLDYISYLSFRYLIDFKVAHFMFPNLAWYLS